VVEKRLKFWLRLLADLIIIDSMATTIFAVRFYSGLIDTPFGIPPVLPYVKLLGLANLVWILLAQFSGAYRQHRRFWEKEISSLGRLYGTVCLAILIFAFVRRDFTYSMTVVLSTFVLALPVDVIVRLLVRPPQRKCKLALIGTGREIREITTQYQIAGFQHYEYNRGWLLDDDDKDLGFPTQRWSGVDNLTNHIQQLWLAPSFTDKAAIRQLLEYCTPREIALKYIPRLPELIEGEIQTPLAHKLVSLNLRRAPLTEYHNRLVKRSFDVVVSGLALVILCPLLLVIALAVWCTSGRPLLIRQKRLSLDGKNFRMLKFRTMQLNAEEESGPVWASADDPRCTTTGKLLRRYNLDELPQFWNVLRGQMSIVGPRPERPYFVRQFAGDMLYYHERHQVRTGITGWSQINGLRGQTSIEARTRYDLYYIENWTIWFDLKIALLTLREFLFFRQPGE